MQFVAIVIPTLALVFTATFAALWLRDRERRHILAYAAGYLALALCYAINMIPMSMATPVLGAMVHFIAMIGSAALVWGAADRVRQRTPLLFLLANTVVSCVMLFEAITIGDPNAIVVIQNGGSAIQFTIGATIMWGARPRDWLEESVVWVMAAIAAVGFLRPVIALLAEGDLAGLVGRTSAFHGVQVVAMTVLPVLLGMALGGLVLRDEWDRQRNASRNDALAGLRGRAAFEEDAKAAIQKALKDGLPLSLIVGDIDHFKRINDGWGHSTGDLVISNVGRTINRMIRGSDIAGRVGGEEFCIIVWDCPLYTAAETAERLRIAIANSDTINGGGGLDVTMSFGVAQLKPGESYASLFERADTSLYRAKDLGRNRVILDGRTFSEADRRHPMEPVIPVHG